MSLRHIVITSIQTLATVASPRGRYAQMHDRPTHALTFCQSGRITYTHLGVQWVSDPDHAILLPQGQSYTLYGNETGDFPVINFTASPAFQPHTFLRFPLQNPESYLKDYQRMQRLLLFEPDHPLAMSILYDMIHRITDEAHPQGNLLTPALLYLQQHFDDPHLTNDLLASHIGISPAHFHRLFRQVHGVSPHQYILDIRIRRAQQLLCQGHSTVTAVSEACGFSSVYHFCRAFKQYTGQTPTEFARLHTVSSL